MDNPVNTSGGTPVRRKIKKVKRPVKRPINSAKPLPVAPKAAENPFNLDDYITPEQTTSEAHPQQPEAPEKVDAFSLDSFLDGNNLPSLQQEKDEPQNDLENNFIQEEYYISEQEDWKSRFMIGGLYTGHAILVTAAIFLFFGIFFSKVFLESSTVSHSGLQGVVVNSEVPKGRARCGVAERTQGCVLYIMNPQRQDLNGRDFYDLAAQLTGRQRFMIETGNMRYSSIKIRPGEIAQLNIPPLQ